jgi:phosphoribosyl 1,2-cyclic phosphate phosphodiesterase
LSVDILYNDNSCARIRDGGGMKVTFLGTGTSTGVPVITCRCKVCLSKDPRNKRLRQSVFVESGGVSILVDATIDMRQQALAYGIGKIDAILVTHPHADHVLGLDETRIFSYRSKKSIPVYGSRETLAGIKRSLWYSFEEGVQKGGGLPELELVEIKEDFFVGPVKVVPLEGRHGSQKVTGFRFERFAYLTDYKTVPPETLEKLEGVKVLAINALRETPKHPTHLTVPEAIDVIRHIKAEKAYLIHLGHEVDYEELKSKLPENIEPAYDGLVIEI